MKFFFIRALYKKIAISMMLTIICVSVVPTYTHAQGLLKKTLQIMGDNPGWASVGCLTIALLRTAINQSKTIGPIEPNDPPEKRLIRDHPRTTVFVEILINWMLSAIIVQSTGRALGSQYGYLAGWGTIGVRAMLSTFRTFLDSRKRKEKRTETLIQCTDTLNRTLYCCVSGVALAASSRVLSQML